MNLIERGAAAPATGARRASWSLVLLMLATSVATAQPKFARAAETPDMRPPQGPYEAPARPGIAPSPAAPSEVRAVPAATAAAPAARSAGQRPAKGTFSAPTSIPADDYYAQRAKSLLSEDAKDGGDDDKSLETAYPGHNVVMCEAGCGGARRIVHLAPRAPSGMAAAEVQPASGQLSARAAPEATGVSGDAKDSACVAGCYTPPRQNAEAARRLNPARVSGVGGPVGGVPQAGKPSPHEPPSGGATGAAAGKWMTTSSRLASPEPQMSDTASRRAANHRVKSSGQRQRRPSNPSGEWFVRINDERKHD